MTRTYSNYARSLYSQNENNSVTRLLAPERIQKLENAHQNHEKLHSFYREGKNKGNSKSKAHGASS